MNNPQDLSDTTEFVLINENTMAITEIGSKGWDK